MKKAPSKIPLYDIYLSAYLQSEGIIPELLKDGTRVVFVFPNTHETLALMQQYNQNPSVKLLDYVAHLRRLRSQMLSMRG